MVGTLMAGKLLDILGGLPEYVCIAFTQEGAEHLGQARGVLMRAEGRHNASAGGRTDNQKSQSPIGHKRWREEDDQELHSAEPAEFPAAQALGEGAVSLAFPKAWVSGLSPKWDAQMEGCWTEFIPRDSTSGWPVLLEKGLAPGEMRAVPVLLHFIRTGRLCDDKEEAKGSGCDRGCSAFAWRRLCWVFRLAQRCDMPPCTEACLDAITAVAFDQLSAPDICTLLDQLHEAAGKQWEQVQRLCTARLVQLFGDVNRLLSSADLLFPFMRLSIEAVLLWAGSDQLQVVSSENDVAVALGEWVGAQPEGSLSAAQLQQLSARVRMVELTPSAARRLLRTDWFQERQQIGGRLSFDGGSQGDGQAGGAQAAGPAAGGAVAGAAAQEAGGFDAVHYAREAAQLEGIWVAGEFSEEEDSEDGEDVEDGDSSDDEDEDEGSGDEEASEEETEAMRVDGMAHGHLMLQPGSPSPSWPWNPWASIDMVNSPHPSDSARAMLNVDAGFGTQMDNLLWDGPMRGIRHMQQLAAHQARRSSVTSRTRLQAAEAVARRTLQLAVTRQQLEKAFQIVMGGGLQGAGSGRRGGRGRQRHNSQPSAGAGAGAGAAAARTHSIRSQNMWLEGEKFYLCLQVTSTPGDGGGGCGSVGSSGGGGGGGSGTKARISLHLHSAALTPGVPASASCALAYQHALPNPPHPYEYAYAQAEEDPGLEGFKSYWVPRGPLRAELSPEGLGYDNLFLESPTFSSVEELGGRGYLVEGALRVCCQLLEVD